MYNMIVKFTTNTKMYMKVVRYLLQTQCETSREIAKLFEL